MLTKWLGVPVANDCGRFSVVHIRGEFPEIHKRYINVDVDAVEQRVADLLSVVLDLPNGAAALAFYIATTTGTPRPNAFSDIEFAKILTAPTVVK